MTTIVGDAQNTYSSSFWSTDTSAQETLMLQNAKSTKTLQLLSTFYKEFNNMENEYSRKLTSLVNRLELPRNESSGTLKTSLSVFQDQCLKMAEAHALQTRRVQQSLQIPLTELISERKAREKTIEITIQQHWSELQELKKKCEARSMKYENVWVEMSTLKSARLTLDKRESQKLEEKLASLKSKMLRIREDNWELVNQYNKKLESWMIVWWNACRDWQGAEEKRIRFLKTHLWELANVCSSFCVEVDQYSETISVALQECSASKDIDYFAQRNGTGDMVMAPLQFVDFAKGETKPLHVDEGKKFVLSEIPALKKQVEKHHSELQRKKIPPSQLSESANTAFTYIGKSKDTFKELQEQTQKEIAELRISNPFLGTKSISEPSTYQVMSDYSNPTTRTSVSSHDIGDNLEHPIFQFDKKKSSDFGAPLNHEGATHNHILSKSESSTDLKEVFELRNNIDILRDSLSPTKNDTSSRAEKRNTFAHLVKNKFNDMPKIAPYHTTGKFEFKQILPTSTGSNYPNDKIFESTSIPTQYTGTKAESKKQRNSSNALRKSKSQMAIHDKHLSVAKLPTTSSEGYPVISHCKAIYSYSAAIEEELSFRKRDILLVLHKQPDKWWFAENLDSGDSGLVPSNYLKELV